MALLLFILETFLLLTGDVWHQADNVLLNVAQTFMVEQVEVESILHLVGNASKSSGVKRCEGLYVRRELWIVEFCEIVIWLVLECCFEDWSHPDCRRFDFAFSRSIRECDIFQPEEEISDEMLERKDLRLDRQVKIRAVV